TTALTAPQRADIAVVTPEAAPPSSRSPQAGRHVGVLRSAPCVLVVPSQQGSIECGIGIDHAVFADGCLVLTGWLVEAIALEARSVDGALLPYRQELFERVDVADAYSISRDDVRGFLLVVQCGLQANTIKLVCPDQQQLSMTLQLPPIAKSEAMVQLVKEQVPRLGTLLSATAHSRRWASQIIPYLQDPPPLFNAARGHIEQAKAVFSVGGIVAGWALSVPTCDILVATSSGIVRSVSEAIRWHRDDITQAFEKDFGAFSLDAGFFLALPGKLHAADKLQLIAVEGSQAFTIARGDWTAAPQEPASFAKWAFDFPLSPDRFQAGLSSHVVPIVSGLIRARNNAFQRMEPEIATFGRPPANPLCSIIIPLYGRADFLQQQLMEFSDDPFVRKQAEIVFVIDDPRIRGTILSEAAMLSQVYELGFTVIDGRVNRGYSGANNLGARHANGRTLLFLNSDVFPTRPGWLQKMLKPLAENPHLGIVGGRLLYCNGSIQHDGMMFEWDNALRGYLNKHPGSGMEPPAPRPKPVERIAVTGACMLMAAEVFAEVGGFDEQFLIGDFEDSDLCLKVRRSGREIVCVEDISLVHLERQSFSGLGSGGFRQRVVFYNLHRHQTAWGPTIDGLLQDPRFRPAA
ncbi:MAG TPA: glycosyltransferase family 2 protein, partial [Tianweitania sediminis]|nr:glycosyltransferase family 2 protein [Tianweitania sediminis]